MRPVLFTVFGLEIHAYGAMLALAFIVAIWGLQRLCREKQLEQLNLDLLTDLGIWALVGALIGARLAYVITEYDRFQSVWEIFKISGGLAFHGGLIGGFGAGYWFTRRKKLNPWKVADLVAPFIALGYAIVRIGCLLNGCCYGNPTALPWAMHCANDSLLRHPTQLYSMVGSLIIFFILWRFRNHKQFSGFLFTLYIALYSVLRFMVEYFRFHPEGNSMVGSWLSLAQLVCLILGLIALVIIIIGRRRMGQSCDQERTQERSA